MFDVVCIGNAKIDSFIEIHHASEHCRLDRDTGELRIKAGEKIPLDSAEFLSGGNACNVSVGLARLGLKSSLIAEIGNDDFAHQILKVLKKENVNISHLKSETGQTGFSVVVNFKGERTLFSQHILRKHSFHFRDIRTKWIYLTSLGKEWKDAYNSVQKWTKENNCKLVLNPGTPQLEDGLEALINILQNTSIFIVNKDEAIELLHLRADKFNDIDKKPVMTELMTKLQGYGPETVIITDGRQGSFALSADGIYYHQGTVDTEVIEKTGAGDSFSTGLLAGLIHGYEIKTALLWGTVNAASVINMVGAQPGLLTIEQMEKRAKNVK